MKFKALTFKAITGLLVFVTGCSSFISSLKPTSHRIGASQRYIEGRYKPFKVHRTIPFLSLQEDYLITKNPHFEAYSRIDLTQGETEASRYHVRGNISGNMQSFGLGLQYYPVEKLSLNLGAEIFHADLNVDGYLNPLSYSLSEDILGAGINAGITLEQPLTENMKLFLSGGYNLTDNITKYTGFNFDGAYAFLGIKINLP